MALAGPDFRSGFVDPAPASNADVGRTVAALLRLENKDKGNLAGRVLTEAMPGGAMPEVKSFSLVSDPAENGLRTVLDVQAVGDVKYFDAAGFPGRTVGLSTGKSAAQSPPPPPPSPPPPQEQGLGGAEPRHRGCASIRMMRHGRALPSGSLGRARR